MFAAYSDLSLLANILGTTHHHHSGWTTLMTTRTMIFPAHGDFKAHIAGNTVISEVQGPWNMQLLQDWAVAVTPLYSQLGQIGVCAGISIHTNSVLTQPECITHHRALTEFAVEHYNFAACASVITADVEGSKLAKTLLSPIFAGIVPYEVFPDLNSAQKWVNLQLEQQRKSRQG